MEVLVKYGLSLVGLPLLQDGENVMQQLVGASDHDHLVGLALLSFFLIIRTNSCIRVFPHTHCTAKYRERLSLLEPRFVILVFVAVNFPELKMPGIGLTPILRFVNVTIYIGVLCPAYLSLLTYRFPFT